MSSAVDEIIITILVIVFILILAFSFYSIYTCTGGTFKQDDWDKDKCFVIPKKSTSPAPAPAKGPDQDPATEPKQSPDSSIIKSVYEEALEYFNNFKPEDNLQFLTGLADDEWSEIQKKSEDDKTKCTVKDASVLFREGEYTEAELKETSDAIKNLCETQLKPDNDFCDNFTLGEISGDDVVNNIPNSGKFKTDYESEKICYTHEPGKCFPRVYNPEGSDGTYSYDLEDGILPASVNGETKYIDTNEICKTLLKKSDCDEKKIDYIYGSDKKICRWVTGIGAYVDPLEVYKNASNTCDEGSAYLQQVGTCEMNTGLDTEMGTYGEGSGAYTGNTSLGTDVVCPGQKLNPNSNGNDDKFIYDYVTRAQCNRDSDRGNNAGVNAKCFFKPKQGTYELREGKRLEKKGEYDLAPNENSRCIYNNNQPCRQNQGDFILCGRCENVTMVGDEHFAKTGRTMVKDDKEYTVSTIGNGNDKVEFAIARITYQELPDKIKDKIKVDMTKINLDIKGFYVTSQGNNHVTFKAVEDSTSSIDVFTVYKGQIENTIENDDRKDGNYHIFITDNTIEKEKWKMKIVGKDVKSDEFYVNDSYKSLFDTSWAKYYKIYALPERYNDTRYGPGTGDTLIKAGYNINKVSSDEFSNKIEFYKNDKKVTELNIDEMRKDNSEINCNQYHDNRKGCNSETTFHHIFKGGHESRCQWKPNVHCYGEWNSPDTVIDGEGKEVPNTCGALVRGLKEERFNELSAQKYSYNSYGVWTKDILAVKGSKCTPEDIGWLDFTDYSESPSGSIATDANKEDRKLPQNYTHGVPYGWWKNARPKHGDVRYTACNVDCEQEIPMKNCEDHSKDNPTEEDRMKLYSGNDDDLDNYDVEKAYYASQKECKGNETKYTVIKKYAQGKGGKKCDNFTFAESQGNFDDFANDYVKHIKGDTCVIPKMMCAAGSSCIVNTTEIDKLVDRINNGENIVKIINGTASDNDDSLEIEIDGTRYNKQNKITKEILFRLAKKECDRFGDIYGFPNKSFCTEDKTIYISEEPGVPPCEYEKGKCYVDEYTTRYTSSAGIKVFYLYKKRIIDEDKWFEGKKFIKPYEFCKWIDMPDAPE